MRRAGYTPAFVYLYSLLHSSNFSSFSRIPTNLPISLGFLQSNYLSRRHPLSTRSFTMGAAPDDFLPAEVEPSVFDAIVAGKLPCKKVYEDDLVLAFHDINPVAPVHILLIPKQRDGLSRLSRADEHNEKVLGHMMVKVAQIVRENDIKDFRLVVNNGPTAGQEVYHLHLHIIAGRKMSWPPG